MCRSDFGLAMLCSALVTVSTHIGCVEHPTANPAVPEFGLRDDISPFYARVIGIERAFAEISDEVPEFAGFHFNESGSLVVSVTDLSKADQVRSRIDAVRADRRRNGARVTSEYQLVEFSFTELRQWRDRVAGLLLEIPEAVFLDLDEVANRVVIGVTDYGVEGNVRALARRLEVPDGAVEFERHSRFVPSSGRRAPSATMSATHLLTHHQDSVLGGVLVKHKTADASVEFCSAWIGARQGSDSMYVTASHCGEFATLEGSGTLHQHLTGETKIGDEDTDPTSTCTVPS